ncbi:MAG: hypothetical protein K8Q89_02155 [Nitrosarchaeum sp.]|nr:hypothetical protein [Nitrosarchaeum sp.]
MYDQKITRQNPALIIFLIDQSSSMSDLMFTSSGSGFSMAKIAKYICDKCLYEAFRTCNAGNEVRPYIDLAIIGYGTSIRSAMPKIGLDELPFSVTKLSETWIKKNDSTPSDNEFESPRYEWVEEVSKGNTPMLEALTKTKKIIEKWTSSHHNSFPPIVINITDGMPTDDIALLSRYETGSLGDITTLDVFSLSKQIQKLGTNNGNVLFCNAHISSARLAQILYPLSTKNIDDPFAELMFELSSTIPNELIPLGNEIGLPIVSGSKFFIYNADVNSLLNFVSFGTTGTINKRLGNPT